MSKIVLAIILICVIVGGSYIGLSCWSSCQRAQPQGPDMPDKVEATHSFYIKNTGGLVLSSDYEVHGTEKGKRIFVLHGFWEMRGKNFKYLDGDIILDEGIFGTITVKRR